MEECGLMIRKKNGYVCLCVAFLTVSVNCLSVVGGVQLDIPCMVFHRMCVCACGPSERQNVPSICFICVFVCRKLFPQLGV